MNNKYLVLLILAVFTLPMSSTYAKNSNSSEGTKELLARIEALEAAVSTLGGTDSSVSGATYKTRYVSSGLGAFLPFPGDFMTVSGGDRTLSFNTDGTGEWTTQNCFEEQLLNLPSSDPFLQSSPANCGTFGQSGFTYVQAGNDVEIIDDITGDVARLSVSTSGEIVTINGLVQNDKALYNFSAGFLSIGIRVGN